MCIRHKNISSEKQFSTFFIILLFAFPLILSGYLPAEVQAAPIELKIGNMDPPINFSHGMLERWAKKIEEQTKGKVNFKIFPSGQLAPAPQVYKAVVNGIMDVGRFADGFTPQLFPLNYGAVFSIIGPPNAEVATRIRLDLYKKFPEIRDEFKDVHVLFLYSTPAINSHTRFPAHTLKDFEGKQIRVPPGLVDLAKALGTYPVTTRMDETYLALSKGIVDGYIASDETLQSFRLAEVTKYTTILHLLSSPFTVAMNKEVWNSLPPEVQEVIDGVSEWASIEMAKENDAALDSAVEFAKGLDNEFITPTPQALEEIFARVRPLHTAWAKDMEAKGKPGNAILEEINRGLKKYSTK